MQWLTVPRGLLYPTLSYLFISLRICHTRSARQLLYICLSRTPVRFTTAPRASVAKIRTNGFTKGMRRTTVLGYECVEGRSLAFKENIFF